eukprot:CAMPEP_0170555704 /NCGR_PEP_ID=MMETSP0211-20121228/13557_1 /TAXON_ID=311385 /ORGANISM="Pseudokeronopsis sp., Strain OXSARD2" /LENGTH=111 /DNA_ID=CAMNT_0010865679 /DNA_START=342 /DNA_END=677 /DNA_ORIENTATION=+
MVYAFMSHTYELVEHRGGDTGKFEMTVNSDPAFVGSLVVIGEDRDRLIDGQMVFWRVHGWILWQAWGVTGILQFVTTRYLKPQWKWAPILHIFSGIYIFVVTMVFAMLAYS